ncbi:MAG: hypothetical protein LBL38_01600, partial [Lactobacillales bacterium]|nr:hypothetical protein [Lactobacillales bacterium]
QDCSLADFDFPGITPENMFKQKRLLPTNPTSIYEVFYFAKSTASKLPITAAQSFSHFDHFGDVASISFDGIVRSGAVYNDSFGLRPACWVKI